MAQSLYAESTTAGVAALELEVRELRGLVDALVNIDQPEFRELFGSGLAEIRERQSLAAADQTRILSAILAELARARADRVREAAERASDRRLAEHVSDQLDDLSAQLDRTELIEVGS